MTHAPLTEIGILDRVLERYAPRLGADFTGYRNHAYRVANLCVMLAPGGHDRTEKTAIAAAFHDLGIWTEHTFDYLEPSVQLARAHLEAIGRSGWIGEVERMIRDHHKVTPSRAPADWLVEPFRQADWIDVSRGVLTFGLSRAAIATIQSAWPSAGFHRRLVQLSLTRLRTHPLSPLPMMRL